MKRNYKQSVQLLLLSSILAACNGGVQTDIHDMHVRMERESQNKYASLEQQMRQKQIKIEQEVDSLKKQIDNLSARYEEHGHVFNLVMGPSIHQKEFDFETSLVGGNVWWLTDRPVGRSAVKNKWEKLGHERTLIDFSPNSKFREYKEVND